MTKKSFIEDMFQEETARDRFGKTIERERSSVLNISYWYLPMKELLKPSTLIVDIPTCILPIGIEEHDVAIEGVSEEQFKKQEQALLARIPEEWLEKSPLFVRTGRFSNKFDFSIPKVLNARTDLYKSVTDLVHDAHMFGADVATEIALREFIPNHGERLTIYNGMPLNTEFRYFYDFDTQKMLGVANYWHEELMLPVLQDASEYSSKAKKDLEVYRYELPLLQKEFYKHKARVGKELEMLLAQNKHFSGKWSIDIMLSGDTFYFIDMALMERSALVGQIESYEGQNTLLW